MDPIAHGNLGENYVAAGRRDDAIASLETTLRLSPGYLAANYWIGLALLFKGEAEAALEAFEQESDEQYRVKGRALALSALGRQDESQARLDELIERWGDQRPAEVAQVYAWTGEMDRAFEWLGKAAEYGERSLPYIITEPLFANLRDDARWMRFLASIGRSPAQLDAIEFEVKLPAQ